MFNTKLCQYYLSKFKAKEEKKKTFPRSQPFISMNFTILFLVNAWLFFYFIFTENEHCDFGDA